MNAYILAKELLLLSYDTSYFFVVVQKLLFVQKIIRFY